MKIMYTTYLIGCSTLNTNIMRFKNKILTLILFNAYALAGCTDFIEIDPPRTDLIRETIFTNESTANAAVMDMYYQMHLSGFASGNDLGLSLLTSLSADDLLNGLTSSQEYQQVNNNTLLPGNTRILSIWAEMYKCIYKANAIIEGLSNATNISPAVITQLTAEAKFIRAFCHFYLVNLFGDIPLVVTSDYRLNQNIARTPSSEVYQQIMIDLEEAREKLPDDFLISENERVRPNKYAAMALLARVYLYLQNWSAAEIMASSIISNTITFQLTTTEEVFLKNSKEAIWQLIAFNGNTWDAETYLTRGHRLTSTLIDAFEVNDKRKSAWVGFGTYGDFYYPLKYQDLTQSFSEYSTVIRLAEIHLIRAEARAHLGKVTGTSSAEEDVNILRTRAGLGNVTAIDLPSMLLIIEQERRVELFSEWGHRWLDLKRTNRINQVLGPLKVSWVPTAALYPIPESQILNDVAMSNAQNPGY